MRFTLRQLQVFVAVAQQESVSRAAGLLALSQSAASTSITELERQTSCQLFDRAGKRLSLNALGRQLLPQAVALLDQAKEIEDLLNGKSGFGSLTVGATLTIGNYLATLLIGSFMMMTLALAVLGLIPDMGIWLVVAAFAVYAFFSGGPGNLQWLYPNELFPTDIRASAVGVIMSLSRIGTILSTWALPIFITKYGISYVMLMGAGISLVGLLISIAFAPETRGLTLAQTGSMTIRRKPLN